MTYAWFDVTRNAGIARIMHMSYRSKTYTWNDGILVKRSMIRVFLLLTCAMYKSKVRHIHDPVSSIDRGRNYTFFCYFGFWSCGCFLLHFHPTFQSVLSRVFCSRFLSILVSAILVMWNVNAILVLFFRISPPFPFPHSASIHVYK